MYIVAYGEVIITQTAEGEDKPREVDRVKIGHYFGERALLTNEPRAASANR